MYTKFILTDPIISPISCIYLITLSLISLLDLQKEAAKDPEEKAVSEDNPNKSPAQQDNSTTVLTTAEKENELQEDKDPGTYLDQYLPTFYSSYLTKAFIPFVFLFIWKRKFGYHLETKFAPIVLTSLTYDISVQENPLKTSSPVKTDEQHPEPSSTETNEPPSQ